MGVSKGSPPKFSFSWIKVTVQILIRKYYEIAELHFRLNTIFRCFIDRKYSHADLAIEKLHTRFSLSQMRTASNKLLEQLSEVEFPVGVIY